MGMYMAVGRGLGVEGLGLGFFGCWNLQASVCGCGRAAGLEYPNPQPHFPLGP